MNKNVTINVSLDKAKKWYNSGNEELKEIAIKVFPEMELKIPPYSEIKTFEDAVNALNMDLGFVSSVISDIETTSKASAAMYKLNIVRKALNYGQDLHFTKEPKGSLIHHPDNVFINKSCTYFKHYISSGEMEVIGKFKADGEEYEVISGNAIYDALFGFGCFNKDYGIGYARADYSLFGCASKEIADHFGKYFGMLIMEAKFGDMFDFEIIEDKYKN